MISSLSCTLSASSSSAKCISRLVRRAAMLSAAAACLAMPGNAQIAASANAGNSSGPAVTTCPAQLSQSQQSFEPRHKGDPLAADFTVSFPGYRVQLGKAGLVLMRDSQSISVGYIGARADAQVEPQERQTATHSYFPAADPATWDTNLPTFGRINYRGLYPGVDLSFYGKGDRLEYDFLVQTGASPDPIQLSIDGAEEVSLDSHGNIVLSEHGKSFTLLKPVAYQPSLTSRRHDNVDVQYVLTGTKDARKLAFRLGQYDHTLPLVIDPVLVYGLYVPVPAGASYQNWNDPGINITAMQADPAGNTYVIGTATTYSSVGQILTKLDPSGHVLWTASLGSSYANLTANAIAIGSKGEVFLAGNASPGLPTTAGAFQPTGQTYQAGYVAAVSPDGSSLDYASYLAGTGASSTDITSAALDSAGKLYVTGSTDAIDFPTTPNAYLAKITQQNYSFNFVTKFDPAGNGASSLIYSTLVGEEPSYGGTSPSVAVDSSGNSYLATAAAAGYPVTNGAYSYDGIANTGAYVTKLNSTGTALVYSAYLGPGSPTAIAVDGSGAAYVAGNVLDYDFPVTAGAYQTAYPGGFALKLAPSGSSLVYSTYLGGPSSAAGGVNPTSVAITPGCASNCFLRVAGTTTTADFPLIAPLQNSYSGPSILSNVGFLVNIKPYGVGAQYSTYVGGETSSSAGAFISTDTGGNVYFASNIQGFDAPVTIPAVVNSVGGFVAKIGEAAGSQLVATPSQIDFQEPIVVDTTSTWTSAVTVRNVGSTSATLNLPFTLSSSDFAETDNCPSTMPAGGSCNVNLTFTPSASGSRTGTLTVNSTTSSAAVGLSGSGVDSFYLTSTPSSLAFGDAIVKSSQSMTLTLQNAGDQVLPVVAISSSLPDYLIANHCPAQIAAGAKCTLTVTFKPTQIGLRLGWVQVQVPGFYYYNGVAYPNEYSFALSGTGVSALTGTGTLEFSQPTYNFGDVIAGQYVSAYVTVMNTGKTPVTINGISTTVGQGGANDFALRPYSCGNPSPNFNVLSLAPGEGCQMNMIFQPSIAGSESATVAISDSAVGSPHKITFTGIGLKSAQTLTVLPSTVTFPGQPVGLLSAPQSYRVVNGADSTVLIGRVHTTGDFVVNDISSSCSGAKLGPQGTCSISVAFLPTATGARTGTLVLTDTSTSTPQVFNLAGTGIAATGSLSAATSTLAFGDQAQGSTSAEQELIFSNVGNSTVKLNQFTATGDFAVIVPSYTYQGPSPCNSPLEAGSTCQVEVVFSPTNANGAETGILTAHSSAGDVVVQLTGTAVAGSQSLTVTPFSANFGPTLTGSFNTGVISLINFQVVNTGTDPVTFTGHASTTNPDFAIDDDECGYVQYRGGALAPGDSCLESVQFNPSTAAAESGKLTLVTSAGTKSLALSGTGVSAFPSIMLEPAVLSFSPQAVGASSGVNYSEAITIYNKSAAAITINSIAVTAGSSSFTLPTGYYCTAGFTLSPGSYCIALITFQPSAAGYRTGTLTIKTSDGSTHTASLVGYGLTPVNAVSLTPGVLAFPDQIANSATANGSLQYYQVAVANTGNRSLTIGTITGTNVSASSDFQFAPYYGCSGASVSARSNCSVSIAFSPKELGTRTGTVTIPITYADNTTTTLTAQLSGTGVSARRAANVTPSVVVFPNTVAHQTQWYYGNQVTINLTNTGNESLSVGTVTGVNVTTTAGAGGDFVLSSTYCTNLSPGDACSYGVVFLPRTAGSLTGSLSFPVTYADGITGTLKASLTGTGVAPTIDLQLSATQLNFWPQLDGSVYQYGDQTVILTNTGNTLATIKSVTASANFTIAENYCSYQSPNCSISVAFTPASTATPGTVAGTLTILDNTPVGHHTVQLVGQAVSANQPLVLSQTNLNLGSQTAGTAGSPQVVYLTNLSNTGVVVNTLALTGANPGDFTMTQSCGGTLGFSLPGRGVCTISIAFTPVSTSTGTRTAAVTITPATGPLLQIQLTGTVQTASSTTERLPTRPASGREGQDAGTYVKPPTRRSVE